VEAGSVDATGEAAAACDDTGWQTATALVYYASVNQGPLAASG